MPNEVFAVGDVVYAKGHACTPAMSVIEVRPDARTWVICCWFTADNQYRDGWFAPEMLTHTAPPDPPSAPFWPVGVMQVWPGALNAIPAGWALCDGALQQIATNLALYAILGTRYGGDGITTFALPDRRGKFGMGAAAGAAPGDTGGAATHGHASHNYTPAGANTQPAFVGDAMPTHYHNLSGVSADPSSAGVPAGTVSAPTFTGTPLAAHAHELPFAKASGGVGQMKLLAQSTFGSGTSRVPESIEAAPVANTSAAAVALSEAKSAGTPAGTISAPTFNGASLPAHSHAVSGSTGPLSAGTPTGTVTTPVFNGTPAVLAHDVANHLPPYVTEAWIIRVA